MIKLFFIIALVLLNINSSIYGQKYLEKDNKLPSYRTYCMWVKFAYPCQQQQDVCGFTEVMCINPPCFPIRQTYSSGCEACHNNVTYYELGACPMPKQDYDCSVVNKKPCNCSKNDSFACGLRSTFGFLNNDRYEYYQCTCHACKDRHISTVYEGLCPQDNHLSSLRLFKCSKNQRNKSCFKEYKGVCAVTESGLEEVANVCAGCSREDVYAVYDGKCTKGS